ncbi:YARHG domain-containing protein [Oceanirhabdus sp. W0125-5]|uniref:YARHG domain-containing protein n=1 Tax=Oceanirhabdus sp. W0125-5 TaxID=2999116 RepID=UPI0022F2FC06|nr:YARHG domain-containing protein [Oceanirhabdus sp. W0125-5]WBW96281.1 YARHG domain-containing protein [Oceanirhabdus sp. W0125-5]
MRYKGIIVAASIIIGLLISGCSDTEKKVEENQNKNTEVVTRAEKQTNNKSDKNNKSSDTNNKSSNEERIDIQIKGELININNKIDDYYLDRLSLSELSLLRNAVYASKGYDFSTKYLKDYFSKYNWYEPSGKEVEDKFSEIDSYNIERIISKEKSYVDDLNNSRNVRLVVNKDFAFNGSGDKYNLSIYSVPYSGEGMINNPIKIVLIGKENSIEYQSDWNDGVFVGLTDIDVSDDSVEVLITSAGTDIVCTTDIYKYSNGKLEKFDTISHFGDNIIFGDNGYLYYANVEGNGEFNTEYNYLTKEKEEIWDQMIRTKLFDKNFIGIESNEPNASQNNEATNKNLVSCFMYKEDLNYDGDKEEIYVEFSEKGDYNYAINCYTIKITNGDKVYTYEDDRNCNLDQYIKFMHMDEKVYFYVYDNGPSGDPFTTVLELTEDGIRKVMDFEGDIADYTRDGRIYTWFSYLGSEKDVVLHYFDIKKGMVRVDESEIIGKEISFNGHLILYSENISSGMSWISEDVAEEIRMIKENKETDIKRKYEAYYKHQLERIIYVAEPGEKLEVLAVDFESVPKRVRNIPVKVRNKNGDIGWLQWLNGGD